MDDLAKRLGLWTVICSVSAAPSFAVSVTFESGPHRIAAMLVGVAIFIALYTWAAGTEVARERWRRKHSRRALVVGYTTRLVVSLLFPIGIAIDMFCGVFSGAVTSVLFEPIWGDPDASLLASFIHTLMWTLSQGLVLNVLLGLYTLAVYGLLRLAGGPDTVDDPEAKLCRRCGYDLRASTGTCPECGEAISEPAGDAPPARTMQE